MRFIINIFFLTLLPIWSLAQIIPGAPQSQGVIIEGGTAHLGNGKVIENAVITFENGKITGVTNGSNSNANNDFQKINATGQHIYPGFIAMNTNLGLVDIGAVRATRDFREVGPLNPHVRSLIAYNTDSKILPTVRSNGVLVAQTCPQGGGISGQSSVMALDGWNWEDAAISADQGIHMNWPDEYRRSGWWAEPGSVKKNEKYAEQVAQISDYLEMAKAYAADNPKVKDLRLESMKGLFDGSKKLYVNANTTKTMEAAILLGKKMDVSIVIVGGREAWQITDFLKSNEIPVVLGPSHSLPRHTDDHIDQPFKTARQLYEAGITVAITRGGNWQNFNLPFQAGQVVGFGLDKEAAVQILTANPSKILGLDDQLGTLEVGKDATLFISSGDALDMRTNDLQAAWIGGRKVDLDNHHKIMARKYEAKYEQEN